MNPEKQWRKNGWTTVACPRCGGAGFKNGPSMHSEDHYDGPECDCCRGFGELWRSAKGVLADYPGGPFRGRETA